MTLRNALNHSEPVASSANLRYWCTYRVVSKTKSDQVCHVLARSWQGTLGGLQRWEQQPLKLMPLSARLTFSQPSAGGMAWPKKKKKAQTLGGLLIRHDGFNSGIYLHSLWKLY